MLKKLMRLGEFFQNEEGSFSMLRIVTLVVTLTLCFDGIWTLVVLQVVWEFSVWKLIWGSFAIGGKVVEKFIENADFSSILTSLIEKKIHKNMAGVEPAITPTQGKSLEGEDSLQTNEISMPEL